MGTEGRKARLSRTKLEELLGIARRWSPMYRDTMAPLVHHLNWQKAEIDRLEKLVTEYEQADFFRKKLELERAEKAPPPPKKETPQKWPVDKRLYAMKRNGITSGPEWDLILKWNRLTQEQALELANQFEAKTPFLD